ncbi:unnamed protein product, partial [marine sediment metagenome]
TILTCSIAIAEVITNVSCNGNSDGEIDITVTGGTAPYNYNWADGTGTGTVPGDEDQTGLTAGTFNVTVTDANGCTIIGNYTVTEPAALSIAESVTNVSCNGGNDGEIDITVTGGTAPYSYNWADGTGTGTVSGDEDQTGLTAGTFNVTVTDANGCTIIGNYTVTEPAALSIAESVTNVSCNGGNDGEIDITVTGGTAPYSYNWADGTGTGTVSGDEDQTGLTAGTFNVTVTDANGCTIIGNYTVTEPAALSIAESVTNVSCNGGNDGEIDITVTGG